MPTATLEACQEKSLQFFLHVNRDVCLNMWRLMYTSLILVEKLCRTNKLIKLSATLPFKALSSLGAPLVHIPSIMIKSLWKNGTRPTCRTVPTEQHFSKE